MYNIYSKPRVPLPQRSRIRKFLMIMTLTKLILLMAVLQVSATALAQKVTLNEKNARLIDVFNDINTQTGYDFAFTTTTLKDAKLVTINVKDQELAEVLTQILKDQNLEFSIENKSVVIKAKDESVITRLERQIKDNLAQVTISGQVVDETGQPMTGVTVREKGTNNVTATDANGNFTISVASKESMIDFTYVGYQPKEIAAAELPKGVVIKLDASETNLHEVIVSKGYYDEKSALSTGSITVVSSKEIEQQPVSDPILALEGRVPGLLISQTTGMPGAYASVQLRGQNSILNGNDPLYIIDGVPFSSVSLSSNNTFMIGPLGNPENTPFNQNGAGLSPFNAINPEDIESIEVLKDADATAIYGSRAGNGVILITTKKGKAGNVKVDLTLSQGVGQVTRFMDLMNTSQYLQAQHQAFANDGLSFPSIKTNPTDPNYDIDGVWDTTRNTNWQKVLIGNTAHYTNAQLSLSGGNQNTQFLVGAGFNRQTTVFPGDFYDAKGSVNFNLTHSSSDQRFHLQFSGGYTYNDNLLPRQDLTGYALQMPPDAPALYQADGSLNWQTYNGTSTFSNPLAFLYKPDEAITNSLTSHLLLSYDLLTGLKLQTSFGYTNTRMNQSNQVLSTSIAPPDNGLATNRQNYFGNSESSNWIMEPQLTYTHIVSKGKLNVVLGATLEESILNEISYGSIGYGSDALITNPANASIFGLNGMTNSNYKYEGLYARVGYTWQDKYLLNLTANRDGSSRFGPGRQYGNFGAIGAGWVFSKEHFMELSAPWLSFGKIRGSYGLTGNDQILDYQYLSTYTTITSTYQGSTSLQPTRLYNPNYGWETVKKLEGGIELGFLKDRIDLTVDYFLNRSGNQLTVYPLPTISGLNANVIENLPAVVQNTGLEFSLHTINIRSGDFRWTSDISLTLQNNKLVSFPSLATSSYHNVYAIGQPLSIKKIYAGAKVNPADGIYEFLAANGSYTENPNYITDTRFTQLLTPKYFGGFGNSFSYKGLSLDVFFEFRKQMNYNYLAGGYEAGIDGYNIPAALTNNTWTPSNQQAAYGKLSTYGAADPNFVTGTSDLAISDASFIRLKTLALSWTLPKTIQEGAHLQGARIFLQAQNLLTITNYFGLDPESGSAGLPPLRMITVGVHTSF